MNRALRTTVYAFAGVMMLSAGAAGARAEYLGYGNGDPGGWDFATEQSGGPCGKGTARGIDRATGQPTCCSQYNPMSACPLYSNPEHATSEHIRHYRKPSSKS
jgi:hypothetical protein